MNYLSTRVQTMYSI